MSRVECVSLDAYRLLIFLFSLAVLWQRDGGARNMEYELLIERRKSFSYSAP